MRCYYTPTWIAKMGKVGNTMHWWICGAAETLITAGRGVNWNKSCRRFLNGHKSFPSVCAFAVDTQFATDFAVYASKRSMKFPWNRAWLWDMLWLMGSPNVIPEEAWKELVCWSLLSSAALGDSATTTQWMSPGWLAGWRVTHCPVSSAPPTDNQSERGLRPVADC